MSGTTDAELRALTPDQLEHCIAAAITAGDAKAVEGYLMLLALKDPHRAQLVLDTIELGLILSQPPAPTDTEEGP